MHVQTKGAASQSNMSRSAAPAVMTRALKWRVSAAARPAAAVAATATASRKDRQRAPPRSWDDALAGGSTSGRRQERQSRQYWQERQREQWRRPPAPPGPPRPLPNAALAAALSAGRQHVQQQAQQYSFPLSQQQQEAALGVTQVPRRRGVTDGKWDAADEAAVRDAQADAAKIERQRARLGAGEVILGRPLAELEELVKGLGQGAYRGKQLRDGVLHGARSVHDITTLSKEFRATLVERGVRTGRSVLYHSVQAADGTRKFLLQLFDGRVVEAVGIPVDDAERPRLTVCVSSQVGCPMRCTFCATGKGGFARNLLPHEIVDQVLTVQEEFGQRVSNVVFMGMGEPLLNLPSVMAAHAVLNKDLGIGARHITVSTVGVPNAIRHLAGYGSQSTLAVSIHAPNQALRESIVPSARAYPLNALMADCAEYFRLTGRRVTFEYTLLAGVNDQPAHAEELGALFRCHDHLRSHVNVIPWNPVDETEYRRPSRKVVAQFVAALERARVAVSVRHTRGLEAAAACGQLRNRHQKEPLSEFADLG